MPNPQRPELIYACAGHPNLVVCTGCLFLITNHPDSEADRTCNACSIIAEAIQPVQVSYGPMILVPASARVRVPPGSGGGVTTSTVGLVVWSRVRPPGSGEARLVRFEGGGPDQPSAGLQEPVPAATPAESPPAHREWGLQVVTIRPGEFFEAKRCGSRRPTVGEALQDRVSRPTPDQSENGKDAMGKLMKRIEKYAKSPEAKKIEQKMMRKAQDPQTKAKISKGFKRFKAKH